MQENDLTISKVLKIKEDFESVLTPQDRKSIKAKA